MTLDRLGRKDLFLVKVKIFFGSVEDWSKDSYNNEIVGFYSKLISIQKKKLNERNTCCSLLRTFLDLFSLLAQVFEISSAQSVDHLHQLFPFNLTR